MNRPPTRPATPNSAKAGCWSLEIVRGREVGRGYAIELGESILGNALNGERGLDLLEQEGSSPRRMAARHAALSTTTEEIAIRDLESPGGTFVNQKRLLAGQSRRLQPGDVIQLGSVQLRVKHNAAPPSPSPPATPGPVAAANAPSPSLIAANKSVAGQAPVAGNAPVGAAPGHSAAAPGRLPIPFAMAGGAQCRTWDDFLVLAAQRWQVLRDELTSGRLAEYLRRIQRAELVPHAAPNRSPDDRLDEWLARLPVTASSAPELDVHPETLLVKAATGGGVTRQSLRVTNVGYRLLKCTARVEPPLTTWIRLRPEHDGQPFQTIEQTELPIELELPETIDRPLRALIVIESNGGSRRVEVRIERPGEPFEFSGAGAGAAGSAIPAWGKSLSRRVARLRPEVRIAAGCAVAIALRLLVLLVNVLPIGHGGGSPWEPRLSSFAIVLAAGGVLAGLRLALRRGERRDLPAAGFAGGAIGLLTAALWFAVIESVERVLGTRSTSIWAVGLLWGAVGGLLAVVSTFLIPHRLDDPEVAP